MYRSLFCHKIVGSQPATLWKMTLQRRYFSLNFTEFFEITSLHKSLLSTYLLYTVNTFLISHQCYKKDCERRCTRDYRPVCASNGKTYPNECEFKNTQCKDTSLTIASKGRCSIENKGNCLTEYISQTYNLFFSNQ